MIFRRYRSRTGFSTFSTSALRAGVDRARKAADHDLVARSRSLPVVTAVVLNYINCRSMLLPCLRHLLRQRDLPLGGMEVLVVHNPGLGRLPRRRLGDGAGNWSARRPAGYG